MNRFLIPRARGISFVAFFIYLIISHGCSTPPREYRRTERYKLIGQERFGNTAQYSKNTSGSCILCVRSSTPTNLMPQSATDFFLYDLEEDSVIFQQSLTDGSVTWATDSTISVLERPGMIQGGESPRTIIRYFFNVRSRKVQDIQP